jgi:hypothetical protein
MGIMVIMELGPMIIIDHQMIICPNSMIPMIRMVETRHR